MNVSRYDSSFFDDAAPKANKPIITRMNDRKTQISPSVTMPSTFLRAVERSKRGREVFGNRRAAQFAVGSQ